MDLDVSVIVPTTGKEPQLFRCLEALLAQTVPLHELLVMLDGESTVESRVPHDPRVRFLTSTVPGSFCAAVNAGIRVSSAPWVFVVNDDVVLAADFLEQLFAGLPDDARIGMICGRLRSADGSRLDSTGQFLRKTWTAQERGYGEREHGQYAQPGYVPSVCAAAALYRRTMLEAIAEDGHYFDERFGMYLEDLDLGLRAQRGGWRAYYVPTAIGTHARGATAKSPPSRWPMLSRYYLPQLPTSLLVRYVLNRYRLIRKHAHWKRFVLDLPWLAAYELRLWGYLLLCRPSSIVALVRAARQS